MNTRGARAPLTRESSHTDKVVNFSLIFLYAGQDRRSPLRGLASQRKRKGRLCVCAGRNARSRERSIHEHSSLRVQAQTYVATLLTTGQSMARGTRNDLRRSLAVLSHTKCMRQLEEWLARIHCVGWNSKTFLFSFYLSRPTH